MNNTMNKKILALSLIAAAAAVPAASFAAPPGNAFISGQIGQSTLQGMSASNDTATGSAFMGGYRWDINPQFQLGAEAGYANIGKFSDSYYGTNVDAKLDGWLVGATGKLNFTPNWFMSFEGGYFGARQRASGSTFVAGNLVSASQSHTKGSWYTGVGFGYDFSNNVGLGLNYNYFADKDGQLDLSSNMVSLRMEVRF
jgi:opacity protein-like surface antigen